MKISGLSLIDGGVLQFVAGLILVEFIRFAEMFKNEIKIKWFEITFKQVSGWV